MGIDIRGWISEGRLESTHIDTFGGCGYIWGFDEMGRGHILSMGDYLIMSTTTTENVKLYRGAYLYNNSEYWESKAVYFTDVKVALKWVEDAMWQQGLYKDVTLDEVTAVVTYNKE